MSKNHIHKLKRHTYKTGNSVYFCVLDSCNFKIGIEFSLGKSNICWRCGQAFEMNSYSIRLAKPHCPDCHKAKGKSFEVKFIKTNQSTTDERRSLPTRREIDPTVLAFNAEESIESLKLKLSSGSKSDSNDSENELVKVVYPEIQIEDEDVEL